MSLHRNFRGKWLVGLLAIVVLSPAWSWGQCEGHYGDVDGDSYVTNLDALMVQTHFLGLLDEFPVDRNQDGMWPEEACVPGDTLTVSIPGGVTMDFALCPAGSFEMGSNGDWAESSEQPVHTVTIAERFYMGKYEVTIEQYVAFMRATGDESGVLWADPMCPLIRNNGDYQLRGNDYGLSWTQPMVYVNWHGATAFTEWMTQVADGTYSLPSEAQWEYACRAGTMTRFSFGDSACSASGCSTCELDAYAVWCSDIPLRTAEVGSKLPNRWGLYDMHGNVLEFCQDWWNEDYTGAPTDGSAWTSGDNGYRVARSGYWGDRAKQCRSASRDRINPTSSSSGFGFRVRRSVAP